MTTHTRAATAADRSERVAVIGASMTQFGQRDAWILDRLTEAGSDCLDDAGVAADAVGTSRT